MTSYDKAIDYLDARIEKLEREIPVLKEKLSAIVDETTAKNCVKSNLRDLKMYYFMRESVISYSEEEPVIFTNPLKEPNDGFPF